MSNKITASLAVAVLALGLTTSASYAGYFVPGETMGTSLDSPLPEGLYAVDLEEYGRSDVQNAATANVGVNIPVLVYSTPITFYNSRLEILAAFPFAHIDGVLNRVGAVTYALGPIIGHDFGHGLTGGVSAFVRTPTPSQNIQVIDGRNRVEGDFRESLSYTVGGITFLENAGFTSAFNNSASTLLQNDFMAGDFTIEKQFGKFTLGATGYGTTDLQNRLSVVGRLGRGSQVEVGGLIGYDFGRFFVRAIVVRSVLNEVSGFTLPPETRGFFVVTVPIVVAPPAPTPVVARY